MSAREINANIKYIEGLFKEYLKCRNEAYLCMEGALKMIEEYCSNVKAIISSITDETKLRNARYLAEFNEYSIMQFLVGYWLTDEELSYQCFDIRKFRSNRSDIYYDDEKEKWICETSSQIPTLHINTYDNGFTATERDLEIIQAKNLKHPLKDAITDFYDAQIEKCNYAILLEACLTKFGLQVYEDIEYLRTRPKRFKEAVKFATSKMYTEFSKQVKKILAE